MMAKSCKVVVNGEEFAVHRGDLQIDAALMNGIDITHDCRSWHSGTCRDRVDEGRVFG
jgi:ferredoxin